RMHAALGRAVCRELSTLPVESGGAAGADDRSAAPTEECPDSVLDGEKGAGQVDGEGTAPCVEGHVRYLRILSEQLNAGVRDDDVRCGVLGGELCVGVLDAVLVGDVHSHRDATGLGRHISRLHPVDVGIDDARPFGGEAIGDGLADAGGRPRDECCLTLKSCAAGHLLLLKLIAVRTIRSCRSRASALSSPPTSRYPDKSTG